jgi:hypothetical protein
MEPLPKWVSESWINTKHNVLGFTLKSYTLHHLMYLYSIESPVLSPTPATTVWDLETACLICTTSFSDDMEEVIANHSNARSTKRWRKQVVKQLHKDPDFLTREFVKFGMFVRDYSTVAETAETYGESKTNETENVKIPWIVTYITVLAMEFGWNEEKIMNLSLGKVMAFIHSINLLKTGETKVLSELDVIAIKLCKGELTLDSEVK